MGGLRHAYLQLPGPALKPTAHSARLFSLVSDPGRGGGASAPETQCAWGVRRSPRPRGPASWRGELAGRSA